MSEKLLSGLWNKTLATGKGIRDYDSDSEISVLAQAIRAKVYGGEK